MIKDWHALTKLVTRLENGERAPRLATGHARVIGITGPPGVGKSSLIDRLIEELRRQKRTVAVIAIDPTSRRSRGALLGDRVRMQRHSEDKGVFIRSLATRSHLGGLTDSTPRIVKALDAAGFDVVIVETIGAGQDEVEIEEVADTVVLVLMPEMGDQIQHAKAGLMEIADVIVINKADLMVEHASSLPSRARPKLEAYSTVWQRPTLHTSAKNGDGISILCQTLDEHHRHLQLLRKRKKPAKKRR